MTTALEISRSLYLIGTLRKAGHRLSEDALVAEWKNVDRIRDSPVRRIEAVTVDLFEDQRREAIRQIESHRDQIQLSTGPQSAKLVDAPTLVNVIFDISLWRDEIGRRYSPEIMNAIERGFTTGLLRVGTGLRIDFTSGASAVRQTVAEVLRNTFEINNTTANQLARSIQDGLQAGETWRQLQDRVSAAFDGMKRGRAMTIARTTATGGFESGQIVAYEEAGIEEKGWLSQRDDVVRTFADGPFDHLEPDGQVVRVSESFVVSGEMLRHPGDPNGSPGNIARCRCSTLPQVSTNGQG